MKATAISNTESSWPAYVPFLVDVREPRSSDTGHLPRQASVGPIELRIEGGEGPSAIAILE